MIITNATLANLRRDIEKIQRAIPVANRSPSPTRVGLLLSAAIEAASVARLGAFNNYAHAHGVTVIETTIESRFEIKIASEMSRNS